MLLDRRTYVVKERVAFAKLTDTFAMTTAAGQELGRVTKKWAGIGKELFTSADTYVIDLTEAGVAYQETAAMLLAAGLAIDTVFKEKQ